MWNCTSLATDHSSVLLWKSGFGSHADRFIQGGVGFCWSGKTHASRELPLVARAQRGYHCYFYGRWRAQLAHVQLLWTALAERGTAVPRLPPQSKNGRGHEYLAPHS
jgi:hypothetical protein